MPSPSTDELVRNLPAGVAQPARRALASAGYTDIEELTQATEAELLELHGMGPKALGLIRKALEARGLSFKEQKVSNEQKTTTLPVNSWAQALIDGARLEFATLMTQIPDDQRNLVGELKQWSPKDEIAHLVYWLEVFVANLRAGRDGRPLINTQNYLAMNDLAWAERRAWTWVEVESALDKVLSALEVEIKNLSAEALVDPGCFTLEPQRKAPRSILRSLLYEVIEHPLHHFVGLYNKFGNDVQKHALFERIEQLLKWRGSAKWTETTRKKIRAYASPVTAAK